MEDLVSTLTTQYEALGHETLMLQMKNLTSELYKLPHVTADNREYLSEYKYMIIQQILEIGRKIALCKIYLYEITEFKKAINSGGEYDIKFCSHCKCRYVWFSDRDNHHYKFDQDIEYRCKSNECINIGISGNILTYDNKLNNVECISI